MFPLRSRLNFPHRKGLLKPFICRSCRRIAIPLLLGTGSGEFSDALLRPVASLAPSCEPCAQLRALCPASPDGTVKWLLRPVSSLWSGRRND